MHDVVRTPLECSSENHVVQAVGVARARTSTSTVYEVAHNIAKFETHIVDGRERRLCVHRKGATRAFAPDCGEVPPEYRRDRRARAHPWRYGPPLICAYRHRESDARHFGSTCHGARRTMSRVKARQAAAGRNIIRVMEERGIIVRGQSPRTVDEEISEACKDVSNVVDACVLAGISRKVAQLRPIGCIKG